MDFSVDPRIQTIMEKARNERSQYIRGVIGRWSVWFHHPTGTLMIAVVAFSRKVRSVANAHRT
jgi:hypothetical protein